MDYGFIYRIRQDARRFAGSEHQLPIEQPQQVHQPQHEQQEQPQEEESRDNYNNNCKICCLSDVQIAFLLCGPSVVCVQCAQPLKNCIICRQLESLSIRNKFFR